MEYLGADRFRYALVITKATQKKNQMYIYFHGPILIIILSVLRFSEFSENFIFAYTV